MIVDLAGSEITANEEGVSVDAGRRRFLGFCAAGVAAAAAPNTVWARSEASRSLAFYNTHTGERLKTTYWEQGQYHPEALAEINHLLRDHRTGDHSTMDRELIDLLHRLQAKVGSQREFQIISGYRSPKTNNMLRGKSGGVAKKSLHMQGKAIDIRLPGTELTDLRKAAIALRGGGVGYYSKSNFIHVDVGRVRRW